MESTLSRSDVMDNTMYGLPDKQFMNIIDAMLPDKLFDAHMHISHIGYESVISDNCVIDIDSYKRNTAPLILGRKLSCNAITYPCDALAKPEVLKASVSFMNDQLCLDTLNTGEIMVMPSDSVDDIEARLIHPQIRGLKCYWTYSDSGKGAQSDIGDYLPEAAWEVADKRRLCITLHLVKDKALADANNLSYIKRMAEKYPNAVLILAHCARAFAAWTVFDTVDELCELENVYFDFSAIAESPAMAYIVKKVGIKRCMWGTDFPICDFIGKPISIGGEFYWLTGNALSHINKDNVITPWRVGIEGLFAFRQAIKLLDLKEKDIEDYFYNNAAGLFYNL